MTGENYMVVKGVLNWGINFLPFCGWEKVMRMRSVRWRPISSSSLPSSGGKHHNSHLFPAGLLYSYDTHQKDERRRRWWKSFFGFIFKHSLTLNIACRGFFHFARQETANLWELFPVISTSVLGALDKRHNSNSGKKRKAMLWRLLGKGAVQTRGDLPQEAQCAATHCYRIFSFLFRTCRRIHALYLWKSMRKVDYNSK